MTSTDLGGASSGGQPGASSDGSAATSPRDVASNAAQAVKREAASFAADAKDKALDQVEQHKETASQTLGNFANAIRKAGDELAQSDQSMAGRMVRQAADGLEGFARSVADKRPEELLDAVRDFGRRNPTAFIAGSVLAGLAIGRFMRSSSAPSASGYGGAREFAGGDMHGLSSGYSGASGSLGSSDVSAAGTTSMGAPEADLSTPGYDAIGEADLDAPSGQSQSQSDLDRSRFGSGT